MTSLDQRVRIAADHRSLSSAQGRADQLAALARFEHGLTWKEVSQ
jgi:hypothetical protein